MDGKDGVVSIVWPREEEPKLQAVQFGLDGLGFEGYVASHGLVLIGYGQLE